MALYFISGIAGSGKSEVCRELKSRRYLAFDTDNDGLAKWVNIDTGYVHPKSSIKPAQRTEIFLKTHSWNIPKGEVEKLALSAKNRSVFLCGVASNEKELWELFDKVFELQIDEKILKHRLHNRTTNDWGKQPHELQQTINALHDISKLHRYTDRIFIDGAQPVNMVVDNILAST